MMSAPSISSGGHRNASRASVSDKGELSIGDDAGLDIGIEKANSYGAHRDGVFGPHSDDFRDDEKSSPSVDDGRDDFVEGSKGKSAHAISQREGEEENLTRDFSGERGRNFDINPTEMYLCIHYRSWEDVIWWCEHEPEQASQWISRYENDGKLRWRILPLHGAILFGAPRGVIGALLGAYPEGAACADDRGNYPLHLVLRTAESVECVQLLLAMGPDCIDAPDENGCVPLVLAKRVHPLGRPKYVRAILQSLRTIRGEVDFDTNPTTLFLYLQKKMWKRDVNVLISRENASVYVCRREANGAIRRRMLPLMAAIVYKAPEDVTEKILRVYPEAAGCVDDRNMLPIHAALQHDASELLVLSLLQAYPPGVNKADGRGRTPMSYAKSSGSPYRDSYIEALEVGKGFYRATKERDFTANPTDLYLAIAQSRWDDAVTAATQHPDQARTWVSQKDRDGGIICKMLPAHACVLFKAPTKVFAAVVRAYPDAASCKDHMGMLPIHHALQHMADVDAVEELLVAYPSCLVVADQAGRTPIMLAEASNSPHRSEYVKMFVARRQLSGE